MSESDADFETQLCRVIAQADTAFHEADDVSSPSFEP